MVKNKTWEVVTDLGNEIGESPVWHPGTSQLHWVDVERGRLFQYEPVSGEAEELLNTDFISALALESDGSLLLFLADTSLGRYSNGEFSIIKERLLGETEAMFNDVVSDPQGRVFFGTRHPHGTDRPGGLYRLNLDGSVDHLVDDVRFANGLGFSPDESTLYFSDSLARTIYAFDYEPTTGLLANRRAFIVCSETDGLPDGLTVDSTGDLWVAHAFTHEVVRYDSTGREIDRYWFPVAFVSSVTFGGPSYSDLYVTSGGGQDKEEYGEHAGALFRLSLDVTGRPEYRADITTY